MYVAKAIYALLAHICRESNLRTFGAYMSQKQFTHFGAYMSRKRFTQSVRKVFAREILPTGKFLLFVSLVEETENIHIINMIEPKLLILSIMLFGNPSYQ